METEWLNFWYQVKKDEKTPTAVERTITTAAPMKEIKMYAK